MRVNINIDVDVKTIATPEFQRLLSNIQNLDRQTAGSPSPSSEPPPANGHNAKPYANGENGRYAGNGRGGGITPKQKGLILSICKREGIDAYSSARATHGCDIDQLSSRDASAWIDQLQGTAATR